MNKILYGTKLKLWLYKKGKTVTSFAREIQTSRGHLSAIINNKLLPSPRLMGYIKAVTNNEVTNY